MKRLTSYFLQGIVFVAPVAVTFWVFFKIFTWVDKPINDRLKAWFDLNLPGVGFVGVLLISLVTIVFVGFLSSNLLTRGIIRMVDRQFSRFPLTKLLHSSVKDLVGAFVGDEKRFDTPVLIEISPGSSVSLVGFVTRKTLECWGKTDLMSVYVPMAFNLGGNLLIVPAERVTRLEQPAAEVMTFVMSGGVAGEPKNLPEEVSKKK